MRRSIPRRSNAGGAPRARSCSRAPQPSWTRNWKPGAPASSALSPTSSSPCLFSGPATKSSASTAQIGSGWVCDAAILSAIEGQQALEARIDEDGKRRVLGISVALPLRCAVGGRGPLVRLSRQPLGPWPARRALHHQRRPRRPPRSASGLPARPFSLLLATFKTDELAQMAQFTKDYLENRRRGAEPGLRDRIRRRVGNTLERVLAEAYDEVVVVGHSMSAVIVIDLLAGWPHLQDRGRLGLVMLGAPEAVLACRSRWRSPPSATPSMTSASPSGTTSSAQRTGSAWRSPATRGIIRR